MRSSLLFILCCAVAVTQAMRPRQPAKKHWVDLRFKYPVAKIEESGGGGGGDGGEDQGGGGGGGQVDPMFQSAWANNSQPPRPVLVSRNRVNPELVKETAVKRGQHPYICSLQIRRNRYWYFHCGTTIYNENTILTAAHCVDKIHRRDMRVVCGDLNLLSDDGTETTRFISKVTVHPNWTDNANQGYPNDVATLKPDSPLVFNTHINTLPIHDGVSRIPRRCQLIGWGSAEVGGVTPTLRKVTIRRIGNGKCKRFWKNFINIGHVCFWDRHQPDSACNGDSGGPAVCGRFLVGIASWVAEHCGPGFPSVYTRLLAFRCWIEKNSY